MSNNDPRIAAATWLLIAFLMLVVMIGLGYYASSHDASRDHSAPTATPSVSQAISINQA